MNRRRCECDIAVVGAGPAGLAAACVAAEAGKRVVVLDNSPWLGGQIWRGEQGHPRDRAAQEWIARAARSGATIYPSATVFGAPEKGVLQAETPSDALDVKWQKLIIATGARELFVPFPGWTLPGVIGPGGLHAMAKGGWPLGGKRVVVAGSGPLLLAVADGLKQHGTNVSLVAEQAPWSHVMGFGLGLVAYPGKLVQGMGVKSRLLGVPYKCGWWPVKAEGDGEVRSVTLTDGSRTLTCACDYLACAFHLVPNVELAQLLGCALKEGCVHVDDQQMTTVPDVYCAGEPTGVGGVECALVEGQVAGFAASGEVDRARALASERARWHRFRTRLGQAFALRDELRRLATADTVVCRCEDVRRGQLEARSGWRDAKLHTRCGMGACQGRTCGAATRFLYGWENDSIRVPILPVRVGTLAAGNGASNSLSTETLQTKGKP